MLTFLSSSICSKTFYGINYFLQKFRIPLREKRSETIRRSPSNRPFKCCRDRMEKGENAKRYNSGKIGKLFPRNRCRADGRRLRRKRDRRPEGRRPFPDGFSVDGIYPRTHRRPEEAVACVVEVAKRSRMACFCSSLSARNACKISLSMSFIYVSSVQVISPIISH